MINAEDLDDVSRASIVTDEGIGESFGPCRFIPMTPPSSVGYIPLQEPENVVDNVELLPIITQRDTFNRSPDAASETKLSNTLTKQQVEQPKSNLRYIPTKKMVRNAYSDLQGHYRKGLTLRKIRNFIKQNYINSPKHLRMRMKLVRRYFDTAVDEGNFTCLKRKSARNIYAPTRQYLDHLHRCQQRAKSLSRPEVVLRPKVKTSKNLTKKPKRNLNTFRFCICGPSVKDTKRKSSKRSAHFEKSQNSCTCKCHR